MFPHKFIDIYLFFEYLFDLNMPRLTLSSREPRKRKKLKKKKLVSTHSQTHSFRDVSLKRNLWPIFLFINNIFLFQMEKRQRVVISSAIISCPSVVPKKW